jgi:hypothetical protein
MKTITQEEKEYVIGLRVKERLSLSEIAQRSGLAKTSCARLLKTYPLTDDERQAVWSSKVKGQKRDGDGRLRSEKLVGDKKFGRLLAIRWIGKKGHNQLWECKCNCGKIVNVRSSSLIAGTSISCGCFARDKARERQCKNPDEVNFRSLFLSYKNSAKARKLEFCLSDDECKELFKGNCSYCGSLPNRERKIHKNQCGDRDYAYLYNGIDRKDNSKGYLKDNCVSCCSTCNYAKRALSHEQFVAWINRLVSHANR